METEKFGMFDRFRSHVAPGTLEEIRAFLEMEEEVREYAVEAAEEGKIAVRMTLEKFSFVLAKHIFLQLTEFMRRSYFNIYAGEEIGEQVRFLYLTGVDGKDGIKMEILIG